MQLNDYQKYIDIIRDLADVENDLREAVTGDDDASALAQRVLFERFGLDLGNSL